MAEFEEEQAQPSAASQAMSAAREQAKNQLKDKLKKQAIKFLIQTFPEWGPFVIGGIVVAVIFLAIFNAINGGAGGTTQEQPSKNVPIEGPRYQNADLAMTGDKQAGRVVLSDERELGITKASELKATTGADTTPTPAPTTPKQTNSFLARIAAVDPNETNSKIREHTTTIIDNLNTVGNGNFEADKKAVDQSVSLVQDAIPVETDDTGAITSPAQDAGPLAVAVTDGTNRQKQLLVELRDQLLLLQQLLDTINQPRLVISERDKQHIRDGEVDIRILKALNYLVTPTKYGGAGHRKIKVDRIMDGYDSEQTANSREWGEQESSDPATKELISPHSTGQAMDISVIGYVDRQLFKKSIAKKKKKPLSPKDILVTNQSKEKGKGLSTGNGTNLDGKTFAEIFDKAGISGLLALVGQNTGYDLSKVKTGTGTIGDISKNVGLAVLSQEIGVDIDPAADNSSLEKIATNLGKGLVAQCLGLPVDGMRGATPEEMRANIGRAIIEERLGLVPRSLSGNTATGNFKDTINSEEIIKSVGKRKLEDSLGIRTMAFDYLPERYDLSAYIGGIVIEQTLNLPAGSMSTDNLSVIKEKIGTEKFVKIFGDEEGGEGALASGTQADKVDGLLGTSFDSKDFGSSRYTYLFKIGRMSPFSYKQTIGKQFLKAKVGNFTTYKSAVLNANGTYTNTNDDANQQDEILDIPDGSVDQLFIIQDYTGAWKNIGLDELTKKMASNDEDRLVVRSWLEFHEAPIDDLGFAFSLVDVDGNYQALDTFKIRTRERILNKDENEITRLKDTIKALEAELELYKKSLDELTMSAKSGNSGQVQLLNQNIKRVEESIRVSKQQLTIEIATIDQWTFITEKSMTDLFLVPEDSFSDIFINNNGTNVFTNIGQIKADTGQIAKLSDDRRAQELNRLQDQLANIEAEKEVAYESASYDSNGNPVAVDKKKIAEQMKAISKREDNLKLKVNDIANAGLIAQKNKLIKDKKICTDPLIQSLLLSNNESNEETIEKVALAMGMKKLEEKFDIPAGVLELTMEALNLGPNNSNNNDPNKTSIKGTATEKQLISIGQKYIEKVFDPNGKLGKNWFDGNTLDDIRSKNITRFNLPNGDFSAAFAAGIESENRMLNAFGYDEKNYAFGTEYTTKLDLLDERYSTLPLSPRDYAPAAAMDNKIIKSFGISVEQLNDINGLSAQLFSQDISPQEFSKRIGSLVVKHKSANEISGSLGVTVSGYKLSGIDIIDTLNGNLLPIAIKIGAEKLDKGLVMPLGTIKAMVDNPSLECQITNEAGVNESCLENILAANGKDTLAHIVGIAGSIAVSDNARSHMGQISIEQALYSPTNPYKAQIDTMVRDLSGQDSLPAGWFDGENLTGVAKNILRLLGQTTPTAIQTTKTDILRSRFTITGPVKDSAITNAVDEKLIRAIGESPKVRSGLTGLTAKLFAQTITPNEYNATVGLLMPGKPSDTPDQVQDNGRQLAERILDPSSTLPAFWFSGNSLDELANTLGRNLGLPQSNSENPYAGIQTRLDAEDRFLPLFGFSASYDYGTKFARADMRVAEQIVIALFHMQPNRTAANNYSDPLSLYGLSNANFSEFTELTTAMSGENGVDTILHLPTHTTEKLLKNSITIDDYKKLASASNLKNHLENNVCKQISGIKLSEDTIRVNNKTEVKTIQNILAKHNLDCNDVVDGLRDSDTLQQKALIALIPPAELGILLGFQSQLGIKIPIKGEFTKNFAQKQIEEVLGLKPGSFNPNQSISSVMQSNGVRQFTKSFKINTPDASMNDNDIRSFISQAVFVESGTFNDQSYWNEPIFGSSNNARADTIDARLKIGSIADQSHPTKKLLTGQITIAQYIELVRTHQFDELTPEQMAAYFVSDEEGQGKIGKIINGYVNFTSLLQDKNRLNDPSTQVGLLNAIKNIGHYDIDDQIGWNPGTMKNILMNRDLAKSILMGQGIREASEAILGPKLSANNPQASLYNDLALLMQYSIPGFSAPFAQGLNKSDATDEGYDYPIHANALQASSSCSAGTVAAIPVAKKPAPVPELTSEQLLSTVAVSEHQKRIEQYNEDLRKYKEYDLTFGETGRVQKRSSCFDFVTKKILGDTIRNATEIKVEENGKTITRLQGVSVPEADLGALLKGDTRILSIIGIAFGVNQVNATQIKKQENGQQKVEYQILPPGFQIGYQEIMDATYGSTTSRLKIRQETTDQFVREQAQAAKLFGGTATCLDEATQDQCLEKGVRSRLNEKDNVDNKDLLDSLDSSIQENENKLIPNSRRNLQFKYLDAQLATAAIKNNLPPPPPNFSKIMFSGTDRERNNMLLSYALTYAVQDIAFIQEVKEKSVLGSVAVGVIEKLATSSDPDRFQNNKLDNAGRDAMFGYFDTKLNGILQKNLSKNTNITLPSGTAQYIYYAATGNTSKLKSKEFTNFAGDFARAQIGAVVDKQLGLPQGSTQTVYDLGQKIAQGKQVTKVDIASVALLVFSKQLAKADAQLGLPPGSLSAVISAVIAPNPISIAFAVYTIVFGYSKIENQMTCFQDVPLINEENPLMSNIDAINWKMFCKENDAMYEQWAKANTRLLINDMLRVGERTRNTSLIPPVIGTFRQEDVDFFNGVQDNGSKDPQADLATLVHGFLPFSRGVKGVHQSDYMKDYVHIQY
ncbi:MAG: hypothetical protein WC045_02810 [Patescibacteria group bacterium]